MINAGNYVNFWRIITVKKELVGDEEVLYELKKGPPEFHTELH